MKSKFSTSINILRDTKREFQYITTPNAIQVAEQLNTDFKLGIRSFNLIGSYGTGKSSFLLAFEQSLSKKEKHFELEFNKYRSIEFIKFIGSHESIIDHFADVLGVRKKRNRNEHILEELFNRYKSISRSKNKFLCIVIDEFGKFLEYAAKHEPEKELFFLQQLAEFCNNPKYNILFVTTLHQGFDSYGYQLSSSQKLEWTKIKGRFKEVTFNEPIDQLLFLASEFIDQNLDHVKNQKNIDKLYKHIEKSKAIDINHSYMANIAHKLFPLDPLAAYGVALSLQKYGQNERSLFTFLESEDATGLKKYDIEQSPFYNLSNVYDYLIYNYFSYLNSKYNIDFSLWSSIKLAIEKVERLNEKNLDDYIMLVKVIGMLNILAAKGANLNKSFLVNYCKISCGIPNPAKLIEKLEDKKIILYRNHSKNYILFEGTDLDIQGELQRASNKVSEVSDIATILKEYFNFQPVLAKEVYFKKGTPRFFEYYLSNEAIDLIPENEIDGYVNLIFSDTIKANEIKKKSANQKEAILYAHFNNTTEIKQQLFDIAKVRKVLNDYQDDRVATREMQSILDAHIRILNHKIVGQLYSENEEVAWYYKGKELLNINNKRDFNKQLSKIANDVYCDAPIFSNELVNRHKISTAVHTAKRRFFKALTDHWDQPNLGFEKDKFPPEKTIFLSLLEKNGLSPYQKDNTKLIEPSGDYKFEALWDLSNKFLSDSKTVQRNLDDLVLLLSQRPIKLKQGVIDFWLASFLFLKRNDFALYGPHGYIPDITYENMILIIKKPRNYSIKAFDIDGVKLNLFNTFRTVIEQEKEKKLSNQSFTDTIRPFIVFHKKLPHYTQQTKNLSKNAVEFLNVIKTAKDPEDIFFNLFPDALGMPLNSKEGSNLKALSIQLHKVLEEIRTCYENLLDRFEEFIVDRFEDYLEKDCKFLDYKNVIQSRFKGLKHHMLAKRQKTFIDRVNSTIEYRDPWLNSLAQALMGNTMDKFNDEDELLLKDRFRQIILELDSLLALSDEEVDATKEEIIAFNFASFKEEEPKPYKIRLPIKKRTQLNKLKENIKSTLAKEKYLNLAALAELIKDLSENE